jgi:nucleolar protein 4
MVGKGRAPPSTAQQDQQRSQVFVRNLPLTLLEPELETLFGEHGPLKRIDLIKTTDQDGIKTSKGFAFIKFALEGDAARAVAAVNGKRVQGRVISAEIALKKGVKQNDSSTAAALSPVAAKAAASKPADTSDDSEGESGDDEGGHAPAAAIVSAKQPKAAATKPAAPAAAVKVAAMKAVSKPAVAAAKPAAAAAASTTATTAGAAEKQNATAAAAAPAKEVPQNVRTVLIYGVARDLGKNALRKRLRKATTIESVAVNDTETSTADDAALPRGCIATVVCVSREGPKKLIEKLDGHTIHSSRIHIRRLLETPPAGEAHAGSGLLKKHRLIVRNLPWAAAEEQLIEAFNAFGPLAEVHIPRYVPRSYTLKNFFGDVCSSSSAYNCTLSTVPVILQTCGNQQWLIVHQALYVQHCMLCWHSQQALSVDSCVCFRRHANLTHCTYSIQCLINLQQFSSVAVVIELLPQCNSIYRYRQTVQGYRQQLR